VRRAELEELIERDPNTVVELVLELRAEVEELKRRLGQNSGNSSKPPSSDPPMSRQERRALARKRAKESLRKAGGQPGHEGKHRQMAPPERVDEFFEHRPERCSGCGNGFEGTEQRVGDPLVHQKWELPPIRPLIHEHRLLRLRCQGCGKATLAGLSAGVSASAFGPRLEAHIATLAGVFRLSRRQVAQAVEEMLGIPISVGAVDATIMRMSAVLTDCWERAPAAATSGPPTSARACWMSTTRFGPSARRPASTPPTTPPSGRCATR